ncbi:MAG: hypothetical protein ACM3ZU_08235 [Bacteroidota bacterium]
MRKTAMVRAVDLRPKRRAAGYSADAFAEILDVSDGKHVCAIETGRCAITIGNALRAAYCLQVPITVEMEGLGRGIVAALQDAAVPAPAILRPGEAAWIVLEEDREALESLEGVQNAVTRNDRDALIRLYEQAVCDTQHAASVLAASLDRLDRTIGIEARERHARKLAAKGVVVPGQETWEAVPA